MRALDGFPILGFALSSELLLAEADTFRPLWHPDLSRDRLMRCLDAIPVEEGGLAYEVAGYQQDGEFPKGVRLHSPLASSIEGCLAAYQRRFRRLQLGLAEEGWQAVPLAHHPVEDRFDGPKANRGYDEWVDAMYGMATYDLKLELCVSPRFLARMDREQLESKVNGYAPAMAGLSLASPLRWNGVWEQGGGVGRSLRLHRKRAFGPSFTVENDRCVFSWFDLSWRVSDLEAYFLLWAEVLLDPELDGSASDRRRAYEMGLIAASGLGDGSRWRAAEALDRAFFFLPGIGLDPLPLERLYPRVETGASPADELLALYRREQSVPRVLREIATLLPERKREALVVLDGHPEFRHSLAAEGV